jgi:hypothetical protein
VTTAVRILAMVPSRMTWLLVIFRLRIAARSREERERREGSRTHRPCGLSRGHAPPHVPLERAVKYISVRTGRDYGLYFEVGDSINGDSD